MEAMRSIGYHGEIVLPEFNAPPTHYLRTSMKGRVLTHLQGAFLPRQYLHAALVVA
jgi:hypothetical protein